MSIGGDDGIRVLRYLNKGIIKKNPKIFIGYSDTTIFNIYINKLGLVSFNDPTIMSGFSQMENFPDCIAHSIEMLFNGNKEYEYRAFDEWVQKYPDWSKIENTGKIGDKIKNTGWHWIQGNSVSEGELFGGCIEIITMLRGTQYWPKPKFFKGKFYFLRPRKISQLQNMLNTN